MKSSRRAWQEVKPRPPRGIVEKIINAGCEIKIPRFNGARSTRRAEFYGLSDFRLAVAGFRARSSLFNAGGIRSIRPYYYQLMSGKERNAPTFRFVSPPADPWQIAITGC